MCRRITEMGYAPHVIRGEFKTVVAAVGEERGPAGSPPPRGPRDRGIGDARPAALQAREPRGAPEPRARCASAPSPWAAGPIVVMAGPCSVESESQMREVAVAVKAAGARILRGGAFKPRTSPYAFQGLKEQGLKYLARGPQADRAARGHRGARDGERRARRRVRRHAPDRRAQHPELHAAPARRRDGQAGPAQARHGHDHPGVPALGRVHPRRGQPERHPLRARHPHLRADARASPST